MGLLSLLAPPPTIAIANNAGTSVEYLGSGSWRITKLSGGSAYNADAVGTAGFAGDFLLRLSLASAFNGNWFGGMDDAPTADSGFGVMAYALLSDNANWYVFENNVNIGAPVANATYGWIWRSGTDLNYGTGATFAIAATTGLIRTVAGVTTTLYFDSSFHDDGTITDIYLTDTVPPISTVYNVSCLGACTPAPALLRGSAKPLATASTLGPLLTRQDNKPLRTTSTPVPTLVRANGKALSTASTPVPTLKRASGKVLLTASTPVPLLSKALAKALVVSSTPVPILIRSTNKPLRTTSTPVPTLTAQRVFLKSLLGTSTPIPTLRRDMTKTLQTATTLAPRLSRAMARTLLTTTTPVPTLSRQFVKSLRVASTPVPSLGASRVFVKSFQAIVGAVVSSGAGVRVTAAFYRG